MGSDGLIREPADSSVARPTRRVGATVFAVVLLVLAVLAVRSTFRSGDPGFHNYGIVHTTLGTAVVVCGGETSDGCGRDTAIRFERCTPQFHAYFDGANADQRVRQLTGARPPAGDHWLVQCGGADAMIEGRPLARLQPS